MTGVSVKDVSSLFNFVGTENFTKAGALGVQGGFGDVMDKAQSGISQSQGQNGTATQAKAKTAEAANGQKDLTRPKGPVKKAEGPEDVAEEQDLAVDETAVEEAAEKLTAQVAEELGVSVEDVEKAMEELGLSVYSLFDPANLTQLVLQVEGVQDATMLLTDEGLFARLQNVLGAAAQVKDALIQESGLSPEEMQSVLKALEESAGAEEAAQDGQVEAPKITVEVKSGDETVKLATDEKGNVTGTVEVTPAKTGEDVTEEHAGDGKKGGGNGKGQEEGRNIDFFAQTLSQDKVQTAQSPYEQTAEIFGQQSRDIMDQILNYMKIQLRPGMSQLEMQLHPESLGTVHIQLVSKGGEVTAQFHVQNEAVKAALESQITTLQENLREQGVKVEAVQVSVESHGFESNLWQGQERGENTQQRGSRRQTRRINLNSIEGFPTEEAGEEELLAAQMMKANGNTVDYTA